MDVDRAVRGGLEDRRRQDPAEGDDDEHVRARPRDGVPERGIANATGLHDLETAGEGTARCTLCHHIPNKVIQHETLTLDHGEVGRFGMDCTSTRRPWSWTSRATCSGESGTRRWVLSFVSFRMPMQLIMLGSAP